jgi:branched-chain amino acid transport system permease protein
VVLLEQVVNGLTLGSLYGLVALGLALLLGVARFANFAHGEWMMLAGYALVLLTEGGRVPYGLAAAAAVAVMAAAGWLFARLVGVRLLERSWRMQLVGTLAAAVLLEAAVILAFGAVPHTVVSPLAVRTVDVGGVTLSHQRLLVFAAVALAFLGLRLFLGRTRTGKAMRALAQNREAAVDLGLDVRRIAAATFVLAGALAGLAGALLAPLYTVTPAMGAPVTFKALAAVVMGGVEGTAGAFAAALLLGVAEALAGGYGLAAWQETMGFAVMVLVLLLRPQGLFGRGVRAG